MFATRLLLGALVILSLAGCADQRGLFGRPNAELAGAGADVRNAPTEEYRLGTGDVISVRVYGGEEEIRLERVRLDNTGVIALPFGEYKAGGSTARELESAITESVKGRLLRNPRIWVSIDEYRPFFVEGQVSRPGAYPFQPGLNVRRAITIAGGFRERAALDKIYLFREQDKSSKAVKVDLNAPVRPGDTVTVQESYF